MLHLYNTLTRKLEDFQPVHSGWVGFYSCGPTVYDFAHIGHARTYIFADIAERVLKFDGYCVKRVMNITDVGHLVSNSDTGEDKMEKGAAREKKKVWEIARFYTDDFFAMCDKLNVKKPEIICRATDHISSMIQIIELLEKKGFTYTISDGVYFDTSKFPEYGRLTNSTYEELQKQLKAGARVEVVRGKKHPTDFALWKFSASHSYPRRQMEWWFTGPFKGKLFYRPDRLELDRLVRTGKMTSDERENARLTIGFPGWHIECSAMSLKYLGNAFENGTFYGERSRTIDIHTGGVDHIPIHHTNEIAQSEAVTGRPFVKFWLHADYLLVDGQKMSKSLGNYFRLKDIEEKGLDPLALRYLFLTASYRGQMNFTWKSMEAAQNAYSGLIEQISDIRQKALSKKRVDLSEENLDKINKIQEKFIQAINDDLNTAQALAIVWEAVKSNISPKDKYDLIILFDEVLGLGFQASGVGYQVSDISDEIKEMIDRRETLRRERKWDEADKIRKELQAKGYLIEDAPSGWKLKPLRS